MVVSALLAAGTAARAQEETEPMLSLDEEFARLAEEIPGFGGLYLDEEGTTHVYLQDLSRAEDVQDLGESVEVHQGDYDFRDLFAWKDEVRELLGRREAYFLDIDEQRNRLLFGVDRELLEEFQGELQTYLRNTRVPPEAVLVEAAEPIVTQEQLTDTIRPVPGGVQIWSSGGACTLSVNAKRLGVRGFITNSHCTATRGVVDGTVMFQATSASADRIGVETVDPAFFTGGPCPSGKKCRRSDAAFFAYDDEDLSEGGQIANPTLCGLGFPGSLDTNPAQPRRPVTGFLFGTPVSGSVVTKVGRTTGCTFGAQKNTCVDANVSQPIPFLPGWSFVTDMTMLCQNLSSAFSQSGDSGSPVFLAKKNAATLAGIHWGRNGSSAIYSPWLFVHSELGGPFPELP